ATVSSSNLLFAVVPTNAVYLRSVAGPGSSEDAMQRVFLDSWRSLRLETGNVASVFGPGTPFVVIEGDESGATEMEAFLNTNLATIQTWVSNGGHLFLNAAPSEDNG